MIKIKNARIDPAQVEAYFKPINTEIDKEEFNICIRFKSGGYVLVICDSKEEQELQLNVLDRVLLLT